MKIHPDQLKALQDLEKTQKGGKPGQAGGFEELLQNSIDQDRPASEQTQPSPGSQAYASQIHAAMQTSPAQSPATVSGAPLMEDIDQVLQQWENYSHQLGSPTTTLRETYATLQGIQRDLQSARQKLSELDKAPHQLASLLNELEVMVQTEEIKINRGDYLA